MNRRLALTAALAAAALLAVGCGKKDNQTVADIGGKKITAGELLIQYNRITPPNRPLFSTIEEKKAFLEILILKEIMTSEARARGLDKNPEVESAIKPFEDMQLLKDMYAEKAQKVVTIDPAELEAFYKTTNAQLRVRDIWFKGDKKQAEEALAAIRGGADFAETARKHSKNEYAANGGDMGFNLRSSNLYALFGDVLDGMKLGDVSDLLDTPAGFHIVQLVEVKPADMAEFEAKKMAARSELRRKKEAQEWQHFLQDLRTRANPTPVPENIRIAQERAKQVVPGEIPSFNDAEKALPLVSYAGGGWTIGDLVYYMGSTSPAFRPNVADTSTDWSVWMTGRAVNRIVLNSAREAGLDKVSDFVERVNRKREELMLDQLHKEIVGTATVTEEEKHAFYDSKKDSMIGPAGANVRYIVTSSKTAIDSAYADLQAGKPFEQVAKRYSEDPRVQTTGGRADSLQKGGMGIPDVDEAVFALEPGKWTKPLPVQSNSMIFQMIEKWPGRQLAYEEVAEQIGTEIRTRKEAKAFDDWIAEKKTALKIKVNDGALKAIIAEEGGDA